MAESSAPDNQPMIEEAFNFERDHYDVSVQALRTQTKNTMSMLLNPPKIFLSDQGLPRDWHGLAQLVGIGGERIPSLQCGANATNNILSLWYQHDKEGATIKNLLLYLEQIDRYDIIDDIKESLDEDIRVFEENNSRVSETIDFEADNRILTRDDLESIREGLQLQKYDAFLLFADEDIVFATELIDKLENQYKLKLCVKDRDLVGGVFEHESVIKLISERCNRLIAILSDEFIASSFNRFFCGFAQSLGIDQRYRKIIPCSYKHCKIPPELNCYFILNYGRAGLGNFWERLRDSIQMPKTVPVANQHIYRSASQKIPTIPESNGIQSSLQNENNRLKPKKEGVKFNSMVNLNHAENDMVLLDQNLNPSSSATSLTTSIKLENNKKSKIKVGWLKKLLPHKNTKCTSNIIIEEVPERHKKGFWPRSIKRKVAVAT